MRAVRRRARLLQVSLGVTVVIRTVEAVRAHALAEEGVASLSGPGVEGNAGVVGGFVVFVMRGATAVSAAHAVVAFLAVVALQRRRNDPVDPLGSILDRYFWAGAVLGFLVVPSGIGTVLMIVPTTLGRWGLSLPLFSIIAPGYVAVRWNRALADASADELQVTYK